MRTTCRLGIRVFAEPRWARTRMLFAQDPDRLCDTMEKLELQLIVVGVDGSPAAAEALEWAVAEACATGARVEAVYAWDPSPIVAAGSPADWRPLREAAAQHAADLVHSAVGEEPGAEVVPRMVIGRAAEILVEESTRADLLVVGSRGLGGLEGIELGSVSHHCAAHAECPLVIVRHDPLRSRQSARRLLTASTGLGA